MGKTEHGEAFVNMLAPLVVENCKKYGWGIPSAIIGHALKESLKTNGISGLASTCYNYWGMKWRSAYDCGYKEYHTKEQNADGTYREIISKFCKYNSVAEGVEGYFKFIEKNPRYKRVMDSKSYTEFATMLKVCGWATAHVYTESIISYVLMYDLTRFDYVTPKTSTTQPTKTEYVNGYIKGKTYTLDANMYIRLTPQGDKVDFYSITTNAQLNAYTDKEGNSILKKGTRVTCKDVKIIGNETWIQIPSGWICGIQGTKKFVI